MTLPICRYVQLARERHRRDLALCRRHGGHPRGLRFDEDVADFAVAFIESLKHSKGEWAGERLKLEPWQRDDVIRPLFGWMRRNDDGQWVRRFDTSYVEVARKNGKSTLAAAIELLLFLGDGEPGAEVYTAATKLQQAIIVHEEAKRMVRKLQAEDAELRKAVRITVNNIADLETESKCQPLGADSTTLDGLNVHGATIDEYHAHKTAGIYEVLSTATGARRQPLIFLITTAGIDEESPCLELHEHAVKVLEGLQDDGLFVYIAAIDDDDDWRDESCWGKANPNLDVSVKRENLRAAVERAKVSPSEQNKVLRLHMNRWTGQATRWLDMDRWDACAGDPIDFESLKGRKCWCGLDLASTQDTNAFVMVFEPADDGPIVVVPHFWIPSEGAEAAERKQRTPYHRWIKEGLVYETEGATTDYEVIRRDINALAEAGYAIQEIAVDRLFQGTGLALQLEQDGFTVLAFGQGFMSMAAPTKLFEELVISGKLRHGGHPVLRDHAGNASVETNAAGFVKPSKKNRRRKIDGIVAAIMGLDRWSRYAESRSVYEDRGVLTL